MGDFSAAAHSEFRLAPIKIKSATNAFIGTPIPQKGMCGDRARHVRKVCLKRQRAGTFNAQGATLGGLSSAPPISSQGCGYFCASGFSGPAFIFFFLLRRSARRATPATLPGE